MDKRKWLIWQTLAQSWIKSRRRRRRHRNQISRMNASSLWVGNLSADVTESDLSRLFGKFGPIVKITLYSSKYFAFVHFKLPQDAKSAKDSLQATLLRSSPLKIDFAKPVCSIFFFSFVSFCIVYARIYSYWISSVSDSLDFSIAAIDSLLL